MLPRRKVRETRVNVSSRKIADCAALHPGYGLRGLRSGARRRIFIRWLGAPIVASCTSLLMAVLLTATAEAQTRRVRVAVPGYTIAVLSFLAAKMNGYYAGEALDVELIAMRAPTAN
jgi:hypothetical protein